MVILFHSSRVYFPFLFLKLLPFSHSWWPLFPSEKLTGAVRGWDINTHMLGPAHLSATLLVSHTLFSPVIDELEPESHPSDSPKCILPSALLINHALLSHSPQHTNVLYSSSKKKKKVLPLLPHIPISSSDIAPCLPTSVYDKIAQRSYLYTLSSLPLFLFSLEATLSQLSCQPLYNTGLLGYQGPPHSNERVCFPSSGHWTLTFDTILYSVWRYFFETWLLLDSLLFPLSVLTLLQQTVFLSLLHWLSSLLYPQNMEFSRISPLTSYFLHPLPGDFIQHHSLLWILYRDEYQVYISSLDLPSLLSFQFST